jgi:predicted secreted hydrolase
MKPCLVTLPADDGSHGREPWEWWYWTGHLVTPEKRWFGFELVFFRVFDRRWPVQLMHAALTDIDGRRFHHATARQPRSGFPVANGFDLRSEGSAAHGGDGRDHVTLAVDGWTADLELESRKVPVCHHEGAGFIRYPAGGYSHYYSRTRMDARGTLKCGELELPVGGSAWFDHQWGQLGPISIQGWDWFALQLDDGRELMLFMLGEVGKRELIGGSLVSPDGQTQEINPADCRITPHREWVSPHSKGRYPLGWTLEVAGMKLVVEPVLEDQEVHADTFHYWEGAATVTGDATGRAYVELTSYGP